MFRTNWVIFFAISIAVLIAGCGDSTGGYGILRSSDMVTVFVPLPDTSEIAEAKVDNGVLHIGVDTGEKIVPRKIKLRSRLFKVIDPDETLEIHGRNRINDYAVIHLRAFHRKYKVSRFIKYHAHKFYFIKTKSGEKPKPSFTDSGAFRFGDRIIAYCRLEDYIDPPPKEFGIYTSTFKIEHTNTVEYKETIIDQKSGHPILMIEKYEFIDSDKTARNLRFLLKDLEPHETVGIEEVRNLGDRIVIVELAVEPQEKQPPKPQLPEQISDR